MKLSTCEKGLHIYGKLYIILGSLHVVIGIPCIIISFIFGLTGTGPAELDAMELLQFGLMCLLNGAFMLGKSFLSLRAVADTNEITLAWAMGLITFIYSCKTVISALLQTHDNNMAIWGLICIAFSGLFLYITTRIRRIRLQSVDQQKTK